MVKRSWMFCALLAACSSNNPVFAPRDGGPPQDRPDIPIDVPVTSIDDTCANALTGPYEESLPVPDQLVAEADDQSARLQWGGPFDTSENTGPVKGYRVCWGSSASSLDHGVLFVDRAGQLFGVPNGVPQVAVVQSIDVLGRVSRPSQMITFSGDRSRVDRLRGEMTGFFDDFNSPEGALDELKWNVAFSSNNDPSASSTYIGPFQHAVSVVANHSHLPGSIAGGDRNQNIARPRAVFDFTGREGRVVIDLDGSDGDRSTWYLDLFPYETQSDLIDVTGHDTSSPGGGHPGRFLRFTVVGNHLMIHQHDASGQPVHLTETTFFWEHPDQKLLAGVLMRHWELRISQNHAAIYIDGVLVHENNEIALDFTRAVVHVAQFGYNPAKANRPWNMIHWDNFGFDGPPSDDIVTHNYKTAFDGSDLLRIGWPEHAATWTVNVPDSLEDATAARFHWSAQTPYYDYGTDDHFMVGGMRVALPEAMSPTSGSIGGANTPFSTSVPVPLAALHTGQNQFAFAAVETWMMNPHLEIDFPAGSAPSYTQPPIAIGRSPVLPLVPIGPQVYHNGIDGLQTENNTDGMFDYSGISVANPDERCEMLNTADCRGRWLRNPVSGVLRMSPTVSQTTARFGLGRTPGIVRVDLVARASGVETIMDSLSTNTSVPTPLVGIRWDQFDPDAPELELDTRTLANGRYEVFFRAYDSDGTRDRTSADPEYVEAIRMDVAN